MPIAFIQFQNTPFCKVQIGDGMSLISKFKKAAHTLTMLRRGRQFATGYSGTPTTGDPKALPANPLADYFRSNAEGPGIWKWRHYFDIYNRHFQRFVGQEVHVVEVGIYSGGSLGMWQSYFGPQCKVYGIDIEPACRQYERDGVQVFIGDQESRDFWRGFRNEVPRVDILIDDGGHDEEQQRATLEEMLPHLFPGGVYLCEDILGAKNGFTDYMSGLVNELNHFQEVRDGRDAAPLVSAAIPFQSCVHSIHFYPYVAVIEKHLAAVPYLAAPKFGTQWQPFFDAK